METLQVTSNMETKSTPNAEPNQSAFSKLTKLSLSIYNKTFSHFPPLLLEIRFRRNACHVYIQKATFLRKIWLFINIFLLALVSICISALLLKKLLRPSSVILNIQEIVLSVLLLSTCVLFLFLGYCSYVNRQSFPGINMLTNNRLPYRKFKLTLNKTND